jgi:hypothetical protein
MDALRIASKACVTNPPIPSPARLRCTCGVFLGNFGGWRAAPLLPQYCSSFFFSRLRGAVQGIFLNVGGGPFKNTHRKVVERWLYGALTGTAQLLSGGSTIFFLLSGPDRLCAPGGEQECPLRATGRWPAGLTCSRTGAHGASFSAPTARKGCPTVGFLEWGNVCGTSVTVPVTIKTSYFCVVSDIIGCVVYVFCCLCCVCVLLSLWFLYTAVYVVSVYCCLCGVCIQLSE